ncbi:glycosyltransferase family 1 protein [Myriangium duriaei CBS 260.36]|uniref:Glycosyltransferase family 1 protein n=1 Tax=Myriangium duriaei CBS 260.36 TaxID=1168546 RepID=A0A9P4MM00_9PEZI|nr:glycosyltransferase family 1 protein [Myriangium duriaei CBS 260.36]
MSTRSSSEEVKPVSRIDVQQSVLHQAGAAATAQTTCSESTTHDALLDQSDLTTSELADEDVPPPAYGDVYGEIHNEKDGLGTSAQVTDEGRVNIRINQLNRRLSRIFSPALRQHLQSVQEDGPPPPPYVPSSLGGEKGVLPPPPLNVVIQVVGSRGDVQPFVAVGKILKNAYGHRVRLATHPNFKDFVQENGLEFFSIGGDPARLMAFMVKNPGLMPGLRSVVSGDIRQRRKDVAEYIQGCWRSCYKGGDGMTVEQSEVDPDSEPAAKPFVADCIIANPPSFAHIHCAEKLGIPLHIMFTMPYSPTQAFPHPLADIQASNADPQLTNYISYAMIEVLSWQGLGDIINRFRKKCLGLDPVSLIWAPGMLQRLKIPHTYCWSPALVPKPKDWGSHISISGFYMLDKSSNYTPALDLQAFLANGSTPVYIGFGSIVLKDPNAMTALIFEAVKKTGQRVILSKGWGGLGTADLHIPNNVFMLDNVPHDWLFKRVSCVVHHGGAGTTSAGIVAGKPTLVVPFFGDQPFWGAMVARAGAGPDPIPHRQLTADKLANAIEFCLRPTTLERAKELASKMAEERGVDIGTQSFHRYLEVERLRCTLAPSRAAVWRIKRTQIKLSAFAACTLANANLLNFHDLKLYRAQEYQTDEGPWDPVSGLSSAVFGAFSDMTMGVADIPSETLKIIYNPSQSSRQKSKASALPLSKKSEVTHTETRSASDSSSPSSSASNFKLSSIPDDFRDQSRCKKDNAGRTLSGSRKKPSSEQDPDVMRSGAHIDRGLGRIVKAGIQAPMDISVSITKGYHNAPRLWGDDTVRPQQKVSDLKSGCVAIGKEFGYGWYDGIGGLVTQPWNGAKKEGASGFLKGIGKGIGGFVTKPSAAVWAIPSYFMKGVHKGVQKLYGSNVRNYIIASRAAQGYEEWLRSSDAEKENVIVRWRLIGKYLRKEGNIDELLRDILEAQQADSRANPEACQTHLHTATSVRPVSDEKPQSEDGESAVLTPVSSRSGFTTTPEELQILTDTNGTRRHGNIRIDANVGEAGQEIVSQLQTQQQESTDGQMDEENLRKAIAFSKAEAKQHAIEAMEYENQLKLAMAQIRKPLSGQRPSLYDQGHLMGTTQNEFDARQQVQPEKKPAQERTEEEIVMEYIKKQSLLEVHHQSKGKGRAAVPADQNDEDLQKALELSLQESESAECRYGKASGGSR